LPIDRDGTLKKAEKLLRQGKLDGAIAEYVRLAEEYPNDWNILNSLGDLYARAGQSDNAAAQFARIADHLFAEGFTPKAAAVYKKILRIRPDDEHTLTRLAEMATRQGVFVDAKNYYRQVADRRRKRGDQRGADEMIVRVGEVDPADADSKIQASRAAQALEDLPLACSFLLQAAEALDKQGRTADALTVLTQAVELRPEDAELRRRLLHGYIAQGDIEQAQRVATTSAELLEIVNVLERDGRGEEALNVLTEAALLAPDNLPLRTRVARECINAGKFAEVRQFLTLEVAGDDPDLLRALARLELQAGQLEEGRGALTKLLSLHPGRRDDLVFVAIDLVDYRQIDAAFLCVDLVADTALLEDDWGGAASALHEFVTRVPNHIPALMRLLDICVDGGLESTMHTAQVQLADAYLEVGRAAEARVIAEDLVAREPWVRANIDRFRRALSMLGVENADDVIAERLSGDSPFLSTMDLPTGSSEGEPARSAAAPAQPVAAQPLPSSRPGEPAPLDEIVSIEAAEAVAIEASEVDLSDVLGSMDAARPAALEHVFDEMRAVAARRSQLAEAEAHYAAAIEHVKHGRVEQALSEFETAARAPVMRFAASARLGRLHVGRGDLARGIEWFERAAEAPAPTVEESHAVMYELAEALENLGERERALAVLIELSADAGAYRDIEARIDRLSKVTRG
jgi:tetratricopeptide (TPR) repeat protein